MYSQELIKKEIESIVKKLINTKIRYHPALIKFFTREELEFISKQYRYNNIDDCKDDINEILRFCIEQDFSSRKKIKEVCAALFPTYWTGFYDGRYSIELSVNDDTDQVLIEYYRKDTDSYRILTKKEFLEFYEA